MFFLWILRNAKPHGFLIDMEVNTLKKFGEKDGTVEWRCADCKLIRNVLYWDCIDLQRKCQE